MEERILVKRAAKGDAEAFGQLYESCYKKLYQYAFYTLQNVEDAEDVVAETVTDAFIGIRKLRKEESFQSWIYAILINKCKAKRKEYLRKSFELTEEVQAEHDYETSNEEAIDIKSCMLKLPEDERTILSMNIFLGYTTKEIANILGINENTVRSKKQRTLEKMRLQLN